MKLIGKIYHWIWFELLCRYEPFTAEFARGMRRHGAFFFLAMFALPILAWNTHPGLGILAILVMSWLVDHLIDYVVDKKDTHR